MNSSLPSMHLILLFLILLPNFSKVQTDGGNVPIGASLSAKKDSSSWTSQSGHFAFGFQPLKNNYDIFLLSIWYNKIPEKTIIWYANGDNPAPEGSKVELTSDKGLVLTTPQGDEIWRSQKITNAVSHVVLKDTGNLVLLDADYTSLWESFEYPTDTLLPSQIFEKNTVLSSKQSKTDFSRGRFQFRLLQDGNLVMNTINLPGNSANEAYFMTNTGGSDPTTSGRVLVFHESGYLYVERKNGQIYYFSKDHLPLVTEFYVRATLDPDGIFALYTYPKASSKEKETWSLRWSLPENICTALTVLHGTGICGYNSICKLGQNKRPTCFCPGGYTLLDPNDQFSSCIPKFLISCQVDQRNLSQDLFTLEELINTNWPTSDYTMLQPFSEEQCKNSCLQDCMCVVAIHNKNYMCWKKKFPLSNGVVDKTLSGTKAFVKVPIGALPPGSPDFPFPQPREKDCKSRITVESTVFIPSLFFNCLLVAAICKGRFLVYWRKPVKISSHENVVETKLHCFTYKELIQATDGFKEELGKGAFGVVYKGLISNSHVAIKKFHTPRQNYEKEFRTKLKVVRQTYHKNLVRLIGFCDNYQDKLLVYEYLSNGSLSGLLFGQFKPDWKQRCQIASDVARGLLYLHEGCSTSIIHCDIKLDNILLDHSYTAKISDLGLAELLQINQSFTDTAIRGTKVYIAPEWFKGSTVTTKVDVYSFGVLLLQIVCCRKSVDGSGEEGVTLTNLAYDCFKEGRLHYLVEGDDEALHNMDKLSKMVMIAICCIQEEPSKRPSMRQITQMLDGAREVPSSCPFLFSRPA